jgi:protein-histidine pros-kinase
MGLRAKFNLAIVTAFLIGFAGAGIFLQRLFVENARQQILQNARIMMSAADAVSHFTDQYVSPLAEPINNSGTRFVAASIPFFAAQTTFKDVQAQFPDYTYREPALNPTNLTDRASDWDADFINAFRNKAGLKELTGMRNTPTGEVLSLARPIAVDTADCLACHSTPAKAPPTVVATYGSANGFSWNLHEVVGAQVVALPMALPLQQAHNTFMTFMVILRGVVVGIVVILNVLLHYAVVKPVVRL